VILRRPSALLYSLLPSFQSSSSASRRIIFFLFNSRYLHSRKFIQEDCYMSSKSMAASAQPQRGFWPLVSPYVVPPTAASLAIVPVFCDMVAKSAEQKGQRLPSMSFFEGVKGGLKAAPTVGAIVGTQMLLQNWVETSLVGENADLSSALASSAVVGTLSAPILAVFNGQTMGWSLRESLRRFTPKQGAAIAVQETAFVAGLSVADKLAEVLKERFGESPVVDYTAAFASGAAGSLAGHPANTALTRWQSGLTLDSFRQSMWGAARKARAVGFFSVIYKFAKQNLNPE
jgi:hypothetical protein